MSLMIILCISLSSCGEEKIEDKINDNVTTSEEKEIEVAEKINAEMKDDIKDISDKVAS